MARKEWELLFNLSAKQSSNFSATFKAAQAALVETQNRIQQLNKLQSDISAYQKQQQAVDATRQRLSVLQQQYDNIQKEIQETEGYSSALENKLISKQAQIDKTTVSLNTYEQRLTATGNTLREAGVDTTQLTVETTRLETEVDKLKERQIDLKKTMDEAGDGAKSFGEKSVEALDAVESALATAGIAKGLNEIKDAYMDCINTAGDFEASMSNVEALSGATGEELEALSDKAKEMGATTKFTAGESADALSYMALAGWNTQSMLEGISPVLNLAAAANMDLAQASDIVTDYLTAFGLKASDTTHFVDVMAYAMAHSNTDVIQLGEAYKACASTATSLGYSVEETTAVLATMANAGVKGGEAGTALNAIFTRLATNTKKCGDELANYGVNIYDAQGNMQSLSSILTGIAGVWGDLTDQEQANLAKTIAGTNQYSKLQTIMAGCSEAAAEGGQSFSDYTEALNNCAGSADKMAGTMLDNMNGRLVLMQSAADGLKIAIGEDLTPAMSGLYDVGAQVLGWMQGFVEEHPGVVKEIAAGTVALGGFLGVMTAASAAIKIGSAAMGLFSASLGVTAPVLAGVVIAGTALAAVIGGISGAADDGVPHVRELTSAARDMGSSMDEVSDTYHSTLSNMEATASVADQYISKLEAIEAATNGNTAGNAEYHDTLARLSALVPSLADDIDLETDSIKGGTEALRQHANAYADDVKAQARQEYLNGIYEQYNDVLVESAANEAKLAAAQAKVEKSNAGMDATYSKLLSTLGMTDEQFKSTYGTVQDIPWRSMGEDVQQLRSEYMGYSEDLATARHEVENYTEAVEQDQEAIDAAEAEYQEAKDAVDSLNAAQQDAAASANDVAAQEQAVTDVINNAEAEIQELVSAYTDAYNAAYDSITKQYDLWDTAEKVVATSASSINSALESQITYWDNYNQNLEKLNERAADIDGLSDVIASFADGSKDSVNAIAGMAAASDSDLAKMVENYRSLQEAQKTTSESMADLETGMSNAMDEIAQNVADSVADMDLGDEALKSAQATVQGFIDGAENMTPLVKEAYERVASTASAALAGANKRYNIDQKSSNIPGYAVGTESAAPGLAIVGENGPELVYFNGGETVLTTPETRSVLNDTRKLSPFGEEQTSTFSVVQLLKDATRISDAVRNEIGEYTSFQKKDEFISSALEASSISNEVNRYLALADKSYGIESILRLSATHESTDESHVLDTLRQTENESYNSLIRKASELTYFNGSESKIEQEDIFSNKKESELEKVSLFAKELSEINRSKESATSVSDYFTDSASFYTDEKRSAYGNIHSSSLDAARYLTQAFSERNSEILNVRRLLDEEYSVSASQSSSSRYVSANERTENSFLTAEAISDFSNEYRNLDSRNQTSAEKEMLSTEDVSDLEKILFFDKELSEVTRQRDELEKVSDLERVREADLESSGAMLVGQRGPELIRFSGGEKVLTASETRSALEKVERAERLLQTEKFIRNLPAYATGTASASRGIAVVGEEGQELVYSDDIPTTDLEINAVSSSTPDESADFLSTVELDNAEFHENSSSSSTEKYSAVQNGFVERNALAKTIQSITENGFVKQSIEPLEKFAMTVAPIISEIQPETIALMEAAPKLLLEYQSAKQVSDMPMAEASLGAANQLPPIYGENSIDFVAIQKAMRAAYSSGSDVGSVATPAQLPESESSGSPSVSSVAPITIAPVYNIYGMRDTDELRSVLNAQNDDLREAVLEIVNDNDTDNFRRGYA